MRKSLAFTALSLSALLALTACGSTTDSAKPGETPKGGETPVTAPTATPITKAPEPPKEDVKKSPRGNLIMQGGDIGTISGGSTKQVETKFSVNAITPITCDQQYSRPSENGQIITVDITVETTPELANNSYPKFTLSGHDFKFIDANGTTFNGDLSTIATYSCIDDSLVFPSAGMGPAEKISAKVVLDVPAAHGILVLKHGLSGGFEYTF